MTNVAALAQLALLLGAMSLPNAANGPESKDVTWPGPARAPKPDPEAEKAAAAIREERARRKAENYAKRNPT